MVHRTYDIGDRVVGIRTTSPRFGDWLDHALSEYRVDAEGDWNFSVVVPDDEREGGRRRLNVLYWEITPVSRTFDLAELARSLLAQLELYPMEQRDDAIYLGSSLLAANGSKVLIPSQVTYYLKRRALRRAERAGVPLPAEPFVAVDPEAGRLVPFRPSLQVPGDALDRLGPARGTDPFSNEVVDQPTDVDALWTVGTTTDQILVPMHRAMALYNLIGATLNLSRIGSAAVDGLARLVQGTPCYGVIPFGHLQIVDALADALHPDGV